MKTLLKKIVGIGDDSVEMLKLVYETGSCQIRSRQFGSLPHVVQDSAKEVADRTKGKD